MSRRLAFAYPIATTSLSIGVENVSRHTDDSHIAVGARFASNTAANSTANALANATAHAAANATAPKNQTTKSGPSDDENTWDNHSSMFCLLVACQILSSLFLVVRCVQKTLYSSYKYESNCPRLHCRLGSPCSIVLVDLSDGKHRDNQNSLLQQARTAV